MSFKIISAGAGSGKTYRLTQEMVGLLESGEVRAGGIIATTFTNKAAAELQERVRITLLEKGLVREARDLTNALIGTVHGLGVRLLKRFAFEAGVSPQVDILPQEDQQVMFNLSLATILTNKKVEEMEYLATRLGMNKSDFKQTDWRKLLNDLTEVVRANDFSAETLEKSKWRSFETFCSFLDDEINRSAQEWNELLVEELEATCSRIENNGDTTKVTSKALSILKDIRLKLGRDEELPWYEWVKISKTRVGTKSRDDLAPLVGFANSHLGHSAFRNDLKSFIFNMFDLAKEAIREYDSFKKSRGLIDYTDMETLVRDLLNQPVVQNILSEELDLLMVDEFQDTSPLQLELFLKLSQLAKHSIWVGDPKQSIYGFRGAEPALMQAIIEKQGGLKKENILEHSWRSREDLVFFANAIFTKAFADMPADQVALIPMRRKIAGPNSLNKVDEPEILRDALLHWHFKYAGEGRMPGREWLYNCLANALRTHLDRGLVILPKGEKEYRLARPGDVAILCRSNKECQEMAEALHRCGLRAAISRAGLLATAEARLILACLKVMLNRSDSLSIAELLLLTGKQELEGIIEDRLDYLERKKSGEPTLKWGGQSEFIQKLDNLRPRVAELSGSEILTLLLDEMDLRRIIVSWGNPEQRLGNVDVFTSLAVRYEENCSRLHLAASLGGFLLWMNDLENAGADLQSSGENPGAVNVVTYHGSKGLEYPLAICCSLEGKLMDEVWGLAIVSETTQVDLDNILGNRWLRLWVNPYSDQYQGTLLAERVNNSSEKKTRRKEALEEEARLLYVGITRARDYLVFPTREKAPLWLNRVCGGGNEDFPALSADQNLTDWEWEGRQIETEVEVLFFTNDFGHADFDAEDLFFLKERQGRVPHPHYLLNLTGNQAENKIQPDVEESYAPAFPLPELQERVGVGRAFRSFLIANYPPDWSSVAPGASAQALLERYGGEGLLEPELFQNQAAGFWDWVKAHFEIKKVTRLYPVYVHFKEGYFQTEVDFLIETQGGLVAVFNLAYVGDARGRHRKIKETRPAFRAAKQALQQVFGSVSVRTFAHFVLYGILVEVNAL